jgi:hypothetical protein
MRHSATAGLLCLLSTVTAVANVTPVPTTKLPLPRDTHGSAIVGRTVYVLGGAETAAWKPTASVLKSTINEDGSLGSWEPTTSLPRRTLYIGASVVAANNHVYVVGGQQRLDERSGDDGEKAVLLFAQHAPVLPDGSLGEWQESGRWDGGGLSCAAATNGRAIYVSGGETPSNGLSDQVFFSPLLADGNLGEWVATSPLPKPLWFHQLSIHGESIFAMSGRSAPTPEGFNREIYRSRILADGSLHEWETLMETNPGACFQGAYSSTRHFVFAVGGKDRNWFVMDKVSYGRATSQAIRGWEAIQIPGFTLERLAMAASGELGIVVFTGGRAKPDFATISDATYTVPIVRDAAISKRLPGKLSCLLPYEEALGVIRSQRGMRMLLVTVTGGSPQSATFAEALCARTDVSAEMQRAYLNVGEQPAEARRLGLLQAGLLATIGPDESVLTRTTEPFSSTLP